MHVYDYAQKLDTVTWNIFTTIKKKTSVSRFLSIN